MVHFIKIVIQISILYIIYQIGNWIQEALNLFIPGSVIGMILLFLLLCFGILKPSWTEVGAQFMLRHLAFFFIPATVGIMNYLDLFQGKGILLLVIVIVSTLLVMLTSGWVSQLVLTRKEILIRKEKRKTS